MNKTHPLASRIRAPFQHRAVRVLVHGVNGIGKTKFGLDSPGPLFFSAERSLLPDEIPVIEPTSWKDLLEMVDTLIKIPMEGCRSLILDTADWLEPKSVRHVCERDHFPPKRKLILPDGRPFLKGYGYGDGSEVLVQEWRLLLAGLDRLHVTHGWNIIMLAHSGHHRQKNAEGDDFDIIGPKLDKKVADLLCEWADAVLYAEFRKREIYAADPDDARSKAKYISDGERICWTQHRGAHRAKNRASIPASIPFSWASFARYALADVSALRKQVEERLSRLTDLELAAKVRSYLEKQPREAGIYLGVLERLDRRDQQAKEPDFTEGNFNHGG